MSSKQKYEYHEDINSYFVGIIHKLFLQIQ